MVEWTITVLKESVLGSFAIIKSIVIIIIPLMIVLQIMTDYKWLEMLSKKTKWVTDFIGVSKDALVPILIGVFAGVSYGVGAILFAREKYALEKKDILLTMCFIIPFHGIMESSLLFWMMGVNPAILIVSRFCIAITGTLLLKQYVRRKKSFAI